MKFLTKHCCKEITKEKRCQWWFFLYSLALIIKKLRRDTIDRVREMSSTKRVVSPTCWIWILNQILGFKVILTNKWSLLAIEFLLLSLFSLTPLRHIIYIERSGLWIWLLNDTWENLRSIPQNWIWHLWVLTKNQKVNYRNLRLSYRVWKTFIALSIFILSPKMPIRSQNWQ